MCAYVKKKTTSKLTRQEIGALGGHARARMYGPRIRSRWARLGGRPLGIQADIFACLKGGPKADHDISKETGWPIKRVQYTLWCMKNRGMVKKINGEWSLRENKAA
jgi:predicted Rossmann fold nucleotide-binding protein DprA/Smf involved in DNA uptake